MTDKFQELVNRWRREAKDAMRRGPSGRVYAAAMRTCARDLERITSRAPIVAMQRETVVGSNVVRQRGFLGLLPSRSVPKLKIVTAQFRCPACLDGIVSASREIDVAETTVTFMVVPCDHCAATYTVELTEDAT